MAEWNSKEYDFKTFIEEFPLPQVVKVIEGIYGTEDEATLSAHDILKLHMLKQYETVKATDERNREFYLPLNTSAKVKVLPNPKYQDSYDDVKKLAEDFPTYVKSKHDHSSLNIEKGDVLKLKEVIMAPLGEKNLQCQFANKKEEDVLIPLSYKAKFKTLGDFQYSLLFLKEVAVKTPTFPVLVKFQDSSLRIRRHDINSGCPMGLDSLGAIILQETFEMCLVVATSCNDQHGSKRTLLTIPYDLDIKVAPVLSTEGEEDASPASKHVRNDQKTNIGSFKIDFNETSFKYGCNIIEDQVYRPGVHNYDKSKPIPYPRKRVTSGVTVTSSQPCDSNEPANDGDDCRDARSCHDDRGQHKEAGAVNKGGVQCHGAEKTLEAEFASSDDPIYEDMCYALKTAKVKQANFDKLVSLKQQHNNNDNDSHVHYTDDDDDDIDAAADDNDVNGDDEEEFTLPQRKQIQDSLEAKSIKSEQDPCYVSMSHGQTVETNDYDIPVIPSLSSVQRNQASSVENPSSLDSPVSKDQHQENDSDDDVSQGGHLCLPPIPPKKSSRYKTRSAVLHDDDDDDDDTCLLDTEDGYLCMTGGNKARSISVNIPDDVHLDEARSRREARRHINLGPSFLTDSTPTHPAYDTQSSTPQTTKKKPKSSIRKGLQKKLRNISQSVLKRSKSTTDIFPEDYQYVSTIPEAKADKQTEIAKLFSQLKLPKKKGHGRENLSAVDYLKSSTIDEVSDSLKSLNLDRYVDTFKAADIDGSLFMDLDDQILEEMNVKKLDQLKIRKLQKEGWTPKHRH